MRLSPDQSKRNSTLWHSWPFIPLQYSSTSRHYFSLKICFSKRYSAINTSKAINTHFTSKTFFYYLSTDDNSTILLLPYNILDLHITFSQNTIISISRTRGKLRAIYPLFSFKSSIPTLLPSGPIYYKIKSSKSSVSYYHSILFMVNTRFSIFPSSWKTFLTPLIPISYNDLLITQTRLLLILRIPKYHGTKDVQERITF